MNIIAITQKGPDKAENEDRIVIGKSLIADGMFQTQCFSGIVGIADGVGGNNAGAAASHFVSERLTALDQVSLEEFSRINEALIRFSFTRSEYENMATTLAGIAVIDGTTHLFSIGNTRVYLLQSRKYLKQLTTDDTTLNYLLATGQLAPENIENFDRKNEITACFGGGSSHLFRMKLKTIGQFASPFMMTSDGIHDYLSVDQMEDIIAVRGISFASCEALIAGARAAGSRDDISIVMGEV